jgi:hypothetical protein
MNKIPAARTIAEAYRFTFAGLGNVIGLIWLPIVLLTVGRYFVMADAAVGAGDPTDLNVQGPIVVRGLAFDLVAAVLFAMMAVAITRDILKPVKRPSFLRFALGPVELRVAGGYIGLFVLMFVFLLGLAMAIGAAGAAGAAMGAGAGKTAAGILVGLLSLAGAGALIFVFVRLSFLLVPAAVFDGGFGLERSWQLTRGNFWRIMLIGLATVIPVAIVVMLAALAIIGPDLLDPHLELGSDQAAQARHMAEIMRIILAHEPMLLGLSFLAAPFSYGLTMSSAAFAYRALTGDKPQS